MPKLQMLKKMFYAAAAVGPVIGLHAFAQAYGWAFAALAGVSLAAGITLATRVYKRANKEA